MDSRYGCRENSSPPHNKLGTRRGSSKTSHTRHKSLHPCPSLDTEAKQRTFLPASKRHHTSTSGTGHRVHHFSPCTMGLTAWYGRGTKLFKYNWAAGWKLSPSTDLNRHTHWPVRTQSWPNRPSADDPPPTTYHHQEDHHHHQHQSNSRSHNNSSQHYHGPDPAE